LCEALCAAREHPRAVLLVDDAQQVEDPSGAMSAALASTVDTENELLVVASVEASSARTMYQHWTRALRRSRLAVLLAPDPDRDGEFAGRVLPRRLPVPPATGRGWLVRGDRISAVQVFLDRQ